MNKKTYIVLLLMAGFVFSFSQSFTTKKDSRLEKARTLRSLDNKAFEPGEVLKYRLHYGIINAGTATLKVEKYNKTIAGRKIYHIIGTGETRGAFNWFFKVRDKYETYIDAKGVFPWLFVRRVNEGGYKINQDYQFYQTKNKVKNSKGKYFKVPENVQDMLSSFYYARTIDFTDAKKGDVFSFNAFIDGEVFPLKLKYMGIDKIKSSGTKYKCLKLHPVIQEGRVFKSNDDVTVWITADKNKILVLAKANVLVGSIKMELTDYENLANPIAIVK